ncbi:hypothetical protein C8R43DRAFT_438268 [Mycena crocata]|nr:hypothetical protein C8R43DRAFT_438268 [Mycena crocata]
MRVHRVLLTICAPLLFLALSSAFPSSLSTHLPRTDGHNAHLMALHPNLHPDEDTSDLENLKAKKQSALYYSSLSGTDIQGAGMVKLTHLYPAVSLERSHFISSVTCDGSDALTVTFTNDAAYQTAVKDWTGHYQGFLIISYVHGCGSGVASSERSFHFVSRILPSKAHRKILCQTKPMAIHDTVHPTEDVNVHVITFSQERKRSSPGAVVAPSRSDSDLTRRSFTSIAVDVFNFAAKCNPIVAIGKYVVDHHKFDSHLKKDATLSTQSFKAYDTVFKGPNKDAYLLYHKDFASEDEKNTTKKEIDFDCWKCGVEITIHFQSDIVPSRMALVWRRWN